MRKILKIIIPLIVLGILGFLIVKTIQKVQYKKEVAVTLETMPAFSFKNVFTNIEFTNAELKTKTNTIFVYFNSTCDYCQHEAENIQEHMAQFSNTQFVFISEQSEEEIKQFAQDYQLENYQNVQFLMDNENRFSKEFDATSLPYLLIYNKNNELIEANKGQMKAETIIDILKNGQ